MQKTQDKLHYFSLYVIFASAFFAIGLVICYLLPQGGNLFTTLEQSVTESIEANRTFSADIIASSFFEELRLLIFAVIAGFSSKRHSIFCCISAYKGLLSGGCSAILMRALKDGTLDGRFEAVGGFAFVLLSALSVCLLCLVCTCTLFYAKRLVYPIKLKYILKRKDTYLYLLDILAICGAILIIIFLKHGNLILLISPKGL